MNSETWLKVKAILADALCIEDPADRDSFVRSACRTDQKLLSEVTSFLAASSIDSEDDPLEKPAFNYAARRSNECADSLIGRTIGNYRLLDQIGAGGMGSVFLAERADGTFEGRMALKLIKRGINSQAALERFLNERRILASLKHPNIARLHDAGTSDDEIPYFVMEYVDGLPITDYAVKNGLDVRQRLELFRQVCSAVTYAHRNLVIHRDLKPSNILVAPDGTPKLLDFGIAKLLNTGSAAAVAVTQQFALTPEYTSPEHLRGDKLTTATDIYSLGVILFELLIGCRPYETSGLSFGEIVRMVGECEIPKPSVAAAGQSGQKFRGDIDNIVLKALRKEPEKRYGSVDEFSDDIRRYLDNLPVSASRDTWRYRVHKFVSRNRYRVTAAALLGISLAAGLAATLYQADNARRERIRAEQRFENVRELANSFMFEINDEIGRSPIRARELLITRAIEYLDKLAQEREDDPQLQSDLASAYERIGNLQAKLFDPGVGKTNDAIASHEKSLEIRRRLLASEPKNSQRGLDVIRSLMHLGDIHSTNGNIASTRARYDEATELARELLRADAQNIEIAYSLARIHARNGQAVLRSGSLGDALGHYQTSLDMFRDLAAKHQSDMRFQRGVGILLSYIGYIKLQTLELEAAADHYGQALAIAREFEASDPQNIQYRGEAVTAHLWFGVALRELGRYPEAMEHLDRAVATQRLLYESDQANRGQQNAYADCLLERAAALVQMGRIEAAEADYSHAIAAYEDISVHDPHNLAARRQFAFARMKLGQALQGAGNQKRALALLAEAHAQLVELSRTDPNNSEWQHDLALCKLSIARAHAAARRSSQAAEYYRDAAAALEILSINSPENARLKADLSFALSGSRSL